VVLFRWFLSCKNLNTGLCQPDAKQKENQTKKPFPDQIIIPKQLCSTPALRASWHFKVTSSKPVVRVGKLLRERITAAKSGRL
jgi:hypothetical protein